MSEVNDTTLQERREARRQQLLKRQEQREEEKKQRHRDKCRERQADKRANRVAKGLCTYCSSEREDENFQLCNKCREKKRTTDAENMSRGLCRNCGGQREDESVQHCKKCRDAQKTTVLKNRYGLTPDDYDRMFKDQNGVCWICKKEETTNNGTLHVDHDDKSGAVRGLLCGNCNRGIGCLQHSIELLTKAIEYLRATEEKRICC